MISLFILSSIVLVLIIRVVITHRQIKQQPQFIHCNGGIHKTTMPDKRPKNFNHWVRFLTIKHHLKFN